MTTRVRLDAELVRRGLARSREQAAELISAGRVSVAGQTAAKAATQVSKDAAVLVAPAARDAAPEYVSRGGHKLAGALAAFGELDVTGRRCLDAGASTGGFTDVLLRAGAAHVVAVDVGYGQLAWSLQTDPRVTVLDRVNVRALEPEQVAPAPSLVVGDLSFISLTLVLPALVRCAEPQLALHAGLAGTPRSPGLTGAKEERLSAGREEGRVPRATSGVWGCPPEGTVGVPGGRPPGLARDYVLMVKPQFEVGKDRVGSGGVVRDPQARADAVRAVADAAAALGLGVRGITASPLPGPSGNVEYFLWLRRGHPPLDEAQLRRAIEEGPA